jgi:hypothetical protein
MKNEYNIEEVKIGDIVEFKTPTNKSNSPVKEVNLIGRMVRINFFEDPKLVVDRVNKWVSFDELFISKKAN